MNDETDSGESEDAKKETNRSIILDAMSGAISNEYADRPGVAKAASKIAEAALGEIFDLSASIKSIAESCRRVASVMERQERRQPK